GTCLPEAGSNPRPPFISLLPALGWSADWRIEKNLVKLMHNHYRAPRIIVEGRFVLECMKISKTKGFYGNFCCWTYFCGGL
ncbi:MAG TPA: hypothetical protein PLS62_13965, partial [Desulfobacteraceae bacterium]|nr:hypothetical protein [Desulfobacteraceae bacterium]